MSSTRTFHGRLDAPKHVVKLGGSLLAWDGLRKALRRFLETMAHGPTAIVVGGGAAADAVRELDRMHGLSAELAHQLAMETMAMNTRVVGELLPELEIRELALESAPAGPWLVEPRSLVRFVEARLGTSVPRSWNVTSDSLAALAARAVGAHELTLLKSAPPPDSAGPRSITRWTESGYVDSYFPEASDGLSLVHTVNLRALP